MVIKIRKHSIALKLILAMILFSSFITLVITALQLYRDYDQDIALIDSRLQEIETVHLQNIKRSIWFVDNVELELTLEGILRLPEMQYLEIREGNDILISVGTDKTDNVVTREYPLDFEDQGTVTDLGVLKAVASLDDVYQRLIDKALLILVGNAIKTFLVAGFILLFFHYLVTRHLIDIARYLENQAWNLEAEAPNLKLNRDPKKSADELDLLVDNLNQISEQLYQSFHSLRATEEKYRLAMDSSRDGLWDYNVTTGDAYFSPGWGEILRLSTIPNGFSDWEQRIHPDDKERILNSLEMHLRGNSSYWKEEHRLRRDDGNWVWVLGRGKVVARDAQGNPLRMLGTMTDISQRMQAEIELQELNRELEQRIEDRTAELARSNDQLRSTLETLQHTQQELVRSDKLASLGSLVAGVAHELNTPLGNALILGTTLQEWQQRLQKDADSGQLRKSTLAEFLHQSGEASAMMVLNLTRAAELINDFKQVAVDQTSDKRRPFDLEQVVTEVVETLQPQFKKTPHEIAIQIPPGIRMDSYPGPLGQIITNLALNSLVHGFTDQAPGQVKISARILPEDRLELVVEDNGCGIPEEHAHHVFDPFFTTRMGQGGSGLGMHIVYTLVTRMLGGSIDLKSPDNGGTRINMSLPLEAPQNQSEGAIA